MSDDELVPIVKETYLSQKPSAGSGLAAAMSLTAAVLFSLIYWFDIAGLGWRLPASGERIFQYGENWRLFTTMFVHADLQHLLANAIGFGALSYLLYGYFGFLVYPCLSLGLSAMVTLISLTTYSPHTRLLGASGMIYFMAAFWLILYLFLERRYSLGKRVLRATGFALIMLVPTVFRPETSYRTHALGFAAGVVCAIGYFLAQKNNLRRAEKVEWDL